MLILSAPVRDPSYLSFSRYIVFPKLEVWIPRHSIVKKIDALVSMFGLLLEEKKQKKADDMLSYMLEDVRLLFLLCRARC